MSDDHSGQRRSSRIRNQPVRQSPEEVFRRGWEAFDTEERTGGDGDMTCVAKIEFRVKGGGDSFSQEFVGSTGTGRGHAEMDALTQFIAVECNWDVGAFQRYDVQVVCTDKPCCCRCAAVLGLLRVSAGHGTYKSPRGMGSTQWGVSPDMRAFLGAFTGVHPDVFHEFYRFQYT
jgi:hypothetical protein